MSLRDYIQVLIKNWWKIVGLAVMLAVIAYTLATRRPPTYEGIITLTVIGKSQPSSQFYNFDGFYSLQANGLVVDIVSSWLASPNMIKEIFDQAGVDLPVDNIKRLRKVLLYNKPSANAGVIDVSFLKQNRADVTKVLTATKSVIQSKLQGLKEAQAFYSDIQLQISDPLVIEQRPKPLQEVLAVGLAGAILAGLIVIIREYIKH